MHIVLLLLSALIFGQAPAFADEAKDQEKVISELQKTGDIKSLQDSFKKIRRIPIF